MPPADSESGSADNRPTGLRVAIIMDGNGRWAERRGVSVTEGHKAGADALHRTTEAALDDLANPVRTALVPGDPRQPAARGPAAVAVHDDRHMGGTGRCRPGAQLVHLALQLGPHRFAHVRLAHVRSA